MISVRKAGITLAALFSAVLVVPVLADGASDFQTNAKKATSTLDQITALLDNIHNHSASNTGGAQQVADTEETMKCPACGMMMTAHATGSNSKSVTIKGKTYFCCAGCNMTKFADKATTPARGANGARRPRRQPAPAPK